MFDSAIWEVGLGLTFVYLVLSLVCTTINERLAVVLKLRSRTLKEGVGHLLRDPDLTGLARDVLSHELVQGLGKTGPDGLPSPSYIPAETFRLALTDVLQRRLAAAGVDPEELRAALDDTGGGLGERLDALVERAEDHLDAGVARSLKALRRASADLRDFEARVCRWYDDTMTRVSGWYVRRIQRWILAIAATVAVLVDADTLMMAEELYEHPSTRVALVAGAREAAADEGVARAVDRLRPGGDAASAVAAASPEGVWQPLAERIELPFGWTRARALELLPSHHESGGDWLLFLLSKLLGLAITTIALSQGAPFWFDLLRKVGSVRGAGGKPAAAE